MSDVYSEIRAERQYQNEKWGVGVDDTQNTPWMWASYIAQYATGWMKGEFLPIGRNSTDAFRKGLIKVAAIAVAAVESIDRQRTTNGKAFYETGE